MLPEHEGLNREISNEKIHEEVTGKGDCYTEKFEWQLKLHSLKNNTQTVLLKIIFETESYLVVQVGINLMNFLL